MTNAFKKSRGRKVSSIVLAVCLILMLLASIIGYYINTNGGRVHVEQVNFLSDVNANVHAYLYIPEDASAKNPAPAVVLCHGYTSSSDAMQPYAIELSRRGYVVLNIDAYGSGETPLPPDGYKQKEQLALENYAPDLGTYSALQLLGTYDFVNADNIAMIGHSMGASAVQEGAYLTYKKHVAGEDVTLPNSLVLASNKFNVRNADTWYYLDINDTNGYYTLSKFPINICTIYGEFDEFTESMWGVKKGADYTDSTGNYAYGSGGATDVASGTYFMYGDTSAKALPADKAARAAAAARETGNPIVASYMYSGIHSVAVFGKEAISYGIEFLDIALKGGNAKLEPANQVWQGRAACGIVGLIASIIAIAALAITLLGNKFFATMVRPEPLSITTCGTPKTRIRYAIIYVLCMLPAPLLYFKIIGYPYYMQPQWFLSLPNFLPTKYFDMAVMNSIGIFNLIIGGILMVIYVVIFKIFAKKAGFSFENTGLKLPIVQILKALLLSIISFGSIYAVVYFCHELSDTSFSFFLFHFKPMDSDRWISFMKYLPAWLFFFMLVSVLYNSFTRINNAPAWLNYILIAVASCGGLAVMMAYNYQQLFATGIKGIEYCPGTITTTAMACIICINLLFILPFTAIIGRILHKKSGNAWLGGFLMTFIVLAYGIANMVISM